MSELSTPALCLIGIIAVAVAVPKYVQLPESLELLFHDKMGQVLLLGLAAVVGSYNFSVGLMMAVFFMSLMLSGGAVEEGFEEENDGDGADEDDLRAQNNGEQEFQGLDLDEELEGDEPEDEELEGEELEGNELEGEELDENVSEEFQSKRSKKKSSAQKKLRKIRKIACSSDNERSRKGEDNYSPAEDFANEEGDLEEGFGCGCQGMDDQRKKKNYLVKTGQVEAFQNPEPQAHDSTNYDVVGCRFDLQSGPETESVNGPPLASCEAYKAVNVENTGTVFYPLN